jgi:O-antigen ligase
LAFCVFELFLALICHFGSVCRFSCLLLILRLFLLLDDLFELFLTFGLLVVLSGVLDSKFKLYAFCY